MTRNRIFFFPDQVAESLCDVSGNAPSAVFWRLLRLPDFREKRLGYGGDRKGESVEQERAPDADHPDQCDTDDRPGHADQLSAGVRYPVEKTDPVYLNDIPDQGLAGR